MFWSISIAYIIAAHDYLNCFMTYSHLLSVGGPLWKNHGESHRIILLFFHSIQILIRLNLFISIRPIKYVSMNCPIIWIVYFFSVVFSGIVEECYKYEVHKLNICCMWFICYFCVLLNRVMDTMFLRKEGKYQILLGATFLPKVFRYSFIVKFVTVVMHYPVSVFLIENLAMTIKASLHQV